MAAQDARSDGADASLALKNEGNAALARGRYAEAISCYSRALEADPSSPVLYSNRAMAHIKAESYGLAIADAATRVGQLLGRRKRLDDQALGYLEGRQLRGHRVVRLGLGNGQGILGKRRPCKKKDASASRNERVGHSCIESNTNTHNKI